MKNKPWLTYLFIGFLGYAKTHLLLHYANRVFPRTPEIEEFNLIISYCCFCFTYMVAGFIIGKYYQSKLWKPTVAYLSFIVGVSFFGLYLNKYLIPLKVPGFLIFASLGYYAGLSLARNYAYKLLIQVVVFATLVAMYFVIPYAIYYGIFSHQYSKRDFPKDYNFVDAQGKAYQQDFFNNKVVLLEYWTTNCGACIDKFAYTDKITENLTQKDQVVVLALNAGFRENIEDFRKFLSKHQARYPKLTFLMDTANYTARNLGIDGFPHEIILDKKGNIRDELSGFSIQYKALYISDRAKILQTLIDEK